MKIICLISCCIFILYCQGKYSHGRLQTLEVASLFLKAAIDRDMNGVGQEEKCHYYQGCIANNKELIRMGQSISYQDKNGKVKLAQSPLLYKIYRLGESFPTCNIPTPLSSLNFDDIIFKPNRAWLYVVSNFSPNIFYRCALAYLMVQSKC